VVVVIVAKVGNGFVFLFFVLSFARRSQHSAGCRRSSGGPCVTAASCAVLTGFLCEFIYLFSAIGRFSVCRSLFLLLL
jgi:hypothetical protein